MGKIRQEGRERDTTMTRGLRSNEQEGGRAHEVR